MEWEGLVWLALTFSLVYATPLLQHQAELGQSPAVQSSFTFVTSDGAIEMCIVCCMSVRQSWRVAATGLPLYVAVSQSCVLL